MPGRDESFGGKGGIEPSITLCQPGAALGSELVILQPRFCEISESLEDDAVIELPCVPDQQFPISGFSFEIRAKGISYVVDATADIRSGDHIDQRARGVRYMYFDRTAPKRFQSEETFWLHVVQDENGTLDDHALFCETARSEDEGFIEELLGKFPMMGCRPAADVALIEERWYENPGICNQLFAAS